MSFEADDQIRQKIFSIKTEYAGEVILIDGMKLLEFGDLEYERENVLLNIQYIGGILAEAQRKLEDMEFEFEALKGRLDDHARNYEFGQRVTEEKIKNFIARNQDYLNEGKQVTKQRAIVSRLKNLIGALRSKKDLIIEKGADRRLEVQYEVGLTKLPKKKGEQ